MWGRGYEICGVEHIGYVGEVEVWVGDTRYVGWKI